MGIFVGIDGGGTHTTLAVADEQGHVLGLLDGDALNYNIISIPVFRQHLSASLAEISCRFGPVDAISMGHSALDNTPSPELVASLMEGVFPAEKTVMQSDVFMALMGTTLGKPGIAVIAGTGSMVLAVDQAGQQYPMGGWGYRLLDEGSGYHIGQSGILAALKAMEGVAPKTTLSSAFMEYYRLSDPRSCIDRFYAPDFKPADMAAFAPVVFSCARNQDPVSVEIISREAQVLADYVCILSQKLSWSSPTVGAFGGLFQHDTYYRDCFAKAVHARLSGAQIVLPRLSPALGALAYYFSLQHRLSDQVLENLLSS